MSELTHLPLMGGLDDIQLLFRLGWNSIVSGVRDPSISSNITKYQAYDFVAGVTAAIWKNGQPKTWLK